MRIKEIFWMLGLRPKIKTYGTKKTYTTLPVDGNIEVSQWLHPKAGVSIPDQREVEELRKFLKPGDVCLDIGAYIGDTAIPMALAVGVEGAVLAFEPNKYVYKVLEENTKLNVDKTRIIPLNFAATPDDAEMEFEYSDSGFCNGGFHENMSKWSHGHAFKLKVKGKNVYKFLQTEYPELISKIKFIKVDAEGFDLSVLRSIEDMIKLVRPHIRVEVFNGSKYSYRKEMYDFFKRHNYTPLFFEGSTHYSGKEISESTDLMAKKHFDIFALPEKKQF